MIDSATVAFWVGGLGQVAAAFATGWIVFQTRKMLERNDRAERLETFMIFSREYDALKVALSHTAMDDDKFAALVAEDKLDKSDIHTAIDMMRLFERQHFLHESHMVDASLWKIWRSGIYKHMRKGLFRHIWGHRKSIPAARHFSERFAAWVDAEFMETPASAAALAVPPKGKGR